MTTERRQAIRTFILRQLDHLYGVEEQDLIYLDRHLDEGIARTLGCFAHLKNKYYRKDDINLLHSVQHFIFLYYLANTINRRELRGEGDGEAARNLCDKLYCLNRMAAACDVYYEVDLPEFFMCDHPLGSVIGRATIGKGFQFLQGCNLGSNRGVYPTLGDYVTMYGNAKVLGNCHIGNRVVIAANAYIKDMDVPDDSFVFGQYPNVIIKENRAAEVRELLESQFIME